MKLKSSAIAYSNIALIKYWGRSPKNDSNLNLPLNDTVSMTKYGLTKGIELKTHTTIEFSDTFRHNELIVNGNNLTGRPAERVLTVINALRKLAQVDYNFKLMSMNDYPTQAGLASSASAFSALTLATAGALRLDLSKKELSTISRLGSGSAARSIYGGFVYFHCGDSHETAFAEQICKPEQFPMYAVLTIVDAKQKKVTSDEGHQYCYTSPFNDIRIQKSQRQAGEIKDAILRNDFSTVGRIAEDNCKYMHAVMMTSNPPLFYWTPDTLRVIKAIQKFREHGLECYFTIDAGPNVHCLCRPEDASSLQHKLDEIKGVKRTILAKPGNGAVIVNEHLF